MLHGGVDYSGMADYWKANYNYANLNGGEAPTFVEDGYYMFDRIENKEAPYTLYKEVSEDGKCSDAYVGNGDTKTVFTYDEYKELRGTVINEDNLFSMTKYEALNEEDDEEDDDEVVGTGTSDTYSQCKDGWWGCAWSFMNKGQSSEHTFAVGEISGLSEIEGMIFDVGNIIFILVTAFLGVKYIWGGVDSKFSVKNSLVTLIVAAIVFYGWNAVTNILNIEELLIGDEASSKDYMVSVVYNTIKYIINFAAVAGIIYIGIKYMMAGAEGKSELKLRGIPVVMGIIMVYGTINLIGFVLKIVEGI